MELLTELHGGLYLEGGESPGSANDPFWVKISGYDSTTGYGAWTEQIPVQGTLANPTTVGSGFNDLPGGRYGTVSGVGSANYTVNPVFDPNKNAVTVGNVVLVRRAYFDPTHDWVYTIVGGVQSFSTVDFTSSTIVLDQTTFNFNNVLSVTNYLGINNVVFNLSQYLVWQIEGPGYVQIDAPVEIGGTFLWDCVAFTFTGGTVDDWNPPTDAVVYNLTAAAGGTTLSGIKPRAFGAPVNTDAITNATNATPIVLTVPGWMTQPAVGQAVLVAGVVGNTATNGTRTVQASTATTVTLQGSVGNGVFAASPGSTVQLAGPQLLVLVNVGADPVILTDASSGASDSANRFKLPPGFDTTLTLAQNDAVTLWWDECTSYQWRVLSTTVQPGITVEHSDLTPVGPRRTISFNDTATVSFAVTDNSLNKSLDVTATATSTATLVKDEKVLLSNYTVTSAFADAGLSIPLPSTGTYLIQAEVSGTITVTGAAGGYISARLYDVTAGAPVADTTRVVCQAQVVSQAGRGSCICGRHYTVAGPVTIRLEAQYTSTGSVSAATILSGTTAAGTTVIRCIKIA